VTVTLLSLYHAKVYADLPQAELAADESVIKCKTRTDHREALIVRGTGYNVDHLD
jgi:hypothetical protein